MEFKHKHKCSHHGFLQKTDPLDFVYLKLSKMARRVNKLIEFMNKREEKKEEETDSDSSSSTTTNSNVMMMGRRRVLMFLLRRINRFSIKVGYCAGILDTYYYFMEGKMNEEEMAKYKQSREMLEAIKQKAFEIRNQVREKHKQKIKEKLLS